MPPIVILIGSLEYKLKCSLGFSSGLLQAVSFDVVMYACIYANVSAVGMWI